MDRRASLTGRVTGLGGTLLPERYIAAQLLEDTAAMGLATIDARTARTLAAWWTSTEAAIGPASPIRAVFDRVAMPLCAILGFTAHDAVFDGRFCRVRLATRRCTPVALLLTTWATRPSTRWVDLAQQARDIGATWGFVLAPPFLSIVRASGHSIRHSLDVTLPLVIRRDALSHAYALLQATAFDPVLEHGGTNASAIDGVLTRAAQYQDDVRDDLQCGVETSLRVLQRVVARARRATTAAPASARLDETLTLVYRILFLLFVESRQLMPTDAAIYQRSYAMSRFCQAAAHGPVVGLWDAFAATSRLSRLGCHTPDLHVSPFNGALFAKSSAPSLEQRRRGSRRDSDARERDEAIRHALIALGSRRSRAGVESINYRDLGVEQLGAVYERVLDLEHTEPRSLRPPTRSTTTRRHSRARKQTGTFYTPQPLADFVVRRTLAPLTEGMSSDAILSLRVVDPAMGSGAFLVSACRYLSSSYEEALLAEGRLSVTDVDDEARAGMRRLIAEKCLWGVDRNPTAVHLARLSLWLTSLARDKPLSFVDHRLRIGDSLVGAWPDDLPRVSQRPSRGVLSMPLFDVADFDVALCAGTRPLRSLLARHDDTVADVRAREADWRQFQSASSPLHRWRMAAHVWCARWFAGPGGSPDQAETRALLDAVVRGDDTLSATIVLRRTREAEAIARDRSFFHWPLEFPDVFYGEDGRGVDVPGFDAVIGNPPWEMVRRDDGDGTARPVELLRYVRQSGQFPSCTTGHLNLYQAFVDRSVSLTRPGGRIGLVLPWSVATDDGASGLRRRLLRDTAIDAVVGIDNTHGLFPIHRGLRFMALTTTVGRTTERVRLCTGLKSADDIDGLPARGASAAFFPVTPDQLRLVSGPSMRIPDARRHGDMALLVALNQRFRPLGAVEGWNIEFGRELNATDVRPYHAQRGIPIVEGKHLSPFAVDAAGANCVAASLLTTLIDPGRISRPRLGYRDVSGVGNRRTLIAAVIPAGVVTTHTVFCLKNAISTGQQHFLCALLNSYVLNAVVRMLMGGHVTTTIAEHLPAPSWVGDQGDRAIARLARNLAERRGDATADAETRLQAMVARRYGLTSVELRHVLAGFPLIPAEERAAVARCFDDITVEIATPT